MLAPFLTLLFMFAGYMYAFPSMEILENEAKAFCNIQFHIFTSVSLA